MSRVCRLHCCYKAGNLQVLHWLVGQLAHLEVYVGVENPGAVPYVGWHQWVLLRYS